ncbi:MAG: beta-lactamase family protein [Clostridia bacterium]|nr:beta-lactamase family protein [Clostridia bacterium]
MQYNIPENVGIHPARLLEFYQLLEDHNLSTHAVYIARGNDIVSFAHWAPFGQDFLHRMYSVSKSFVSIAIGFCRQDGLLDLDDPIIKYFPKEMEHQTDANMRSQTIRHMLMMSTARGAQNWFSVRSDDRVQTYFDNTNPSRPSGTQFEYDSSGSFVLGALVERLTGMKFMEYLRLKLFDRIGVSKAAYCLECPGGHSWGDSGVMCTSLDLLKMVRFVANGGSWNGEQLLDAEYVRLASTKQIDNNIHGIPGWETNGYGYQIWIGYEDSFFFNGMGCQFGLYMPKKDLLLVYNGDNQGKAQSLKIIFDGFMDLIYKTASDTPLEPCPDLRHQLRIRENTMALMADRGEMTSPMLEKINGRTFALEKNPMGIDKFSITIPEDGLGSFCYTNEQGDLTLYFGMGENVFGDFPHAGYAQKVGSVFVPGHRYKCAASAAWYSPYQLHLKAQIIDDYFGTLNILFGFRDDGRVGVQMVKVAEDFLHTYNGWADGVLAE